MNFKKFSVKALALVMTLTMLVAVLAPVVSAVNADQENKIVLVSLGDSMTNGYGFDGYSQGKNQLGGFGGNVFVSGGEGIYGVDAYPDQFAEWLEENGKEVTHHKLAVSAMRTEDLLYLLGGGSYEIFSKYGEKQVKNYTNENDLDKLMAYYQDCVKDADIITMGVGNASFGAYLMDYMMRAMGVFGGSINEDYDVTLEDALLLLEDEAQREVVLKFADKVKTEILDKIPADMLAVENADEKLELLYNGIAYVTATFVVGYKQLIDKIVELNPDVEIIMVGLMNTLDGLELTAEGMAPINAGDAMDSAFSVLNAYIAALPTVKQLAGDWSDATFYYAAQPHPKYVFQAYNQLMDTNWAKVDCGDPLCADCLAGEGCENGRLSGNIVRDRNITAYNDMILPMISGIAGIPLPEITRQDVEAYEYYAAVTLPGLITDVEDTYINPLKATIATLEEQIAANQGNDYMLGVLNGYLAEAEAGLAAAEAGKAALERGFSSEANVMKEVAIAFYLGLEGAIADNIETNQISLDSMKGLLGGLEGVFSAAGEYIDTNLATATFAGFSDGFRALLNSSDDLKGLCKIYGMFKAGDGLAAHPTPSGHDDLANVIIEVYAHGHTAMDETKQNVMIVLGYAADLANKYYDDAVAYAKAYVAEKGYVALVDEAIDNALATLDALGVVTADMDAAIKADIKAEIERTVAALEALRAAVVDAKIQTVEDFTATVAAIKAEITAYVANVKAIVETSGIDADVVDAIEAVKAAIAEVSVVANRVAAAPAVIDEAILATGELAVVAAGLADAAIKAAVEAEIDATVATLVALKAALAGVGYDAVEDVTTVIADYKAELADRLATIEELMAVAGASEDDLAKVRNAIALVQDGIVPATDSVLGANGVVARALAVVNALKNAAANTDASFKAAADAEVARTLAVLATLSATLEAAGEYTAEEFDAIVADVVAELEACMAAVEVLLDKAEVAANAIYAVQNTAKAIVNDVFNATVVVVTNVNDITYDFIYNKMGATYDELVAAINVAAAELNPARLAALNNWLKNASNEVVALLAAGGDNIYTFAARLQDIIAQDEALKGAAAALGVVAGLIYEYYDEAYIFGYNYALMNGYVAEAVAAIDAAIAKIEAVDLSVLGVTAELEAEIAAELALTVATLEELKAALENNDANTVDGLIATVVALSDDLDAHIAAIAAICEQAGVDVNVLVIIPHIEEYVIPTVEEAKAKLEAYYAEGVAYAEAYIAELEATIEAIAAELDADIQAQLNVLLAKLAEYDAYFADVQIKTQEELVAFLADFEKKINACIADLEAVLADLEAEAQYQIEIVIALANDVVACAKAQVATMVDQINAYLMAKVDEAYAQLADILAAAAAKVNFPLVNELYNWLVKNPEDILAILAEVAYGHIKHVDEAIAAAFASFYNGLITGEYGISVDSYYVAIADYDNTYADLFAAALELGNDQYSKLDWNDVDLGELVKADLITIGYNEGKLAGFAIDQAVGAAKNYVDSELRASALAYAEGLVAKVVDEVFNRQDLFADIIADLYAGVDASVNGAIDEIVNNELIAGKTYVELDWAALLGEDNVAYVDQYRAELRETLIANGIEETVSFEINALELLLADEATRAALEAQLNGLITGGLDAIVEIIGDDAIFTVEIPVVDFAVVAAESYAYEYLLYTAKYAELVVTTKLVNPNATIILLGNHNPANGMSITIGDTEIDLGDAYSNLIKATAVQGSIYALLTGATYVDIADAQTNYAAALEAGLIDNSILSFAMVYLYDSSMLDLSAAGHAYVKDQIMNAMSFYCVHNFAPATCTEPQICTLCGATNGTPNGHNWTDADCTNPRHCVDCGATFGVALGHTPGEWVVEDSTCTENGVKNQYCTVCGELLATEAIDATGHTAGEWTVVTAPTCTTEGSSQKTCTVCGVVVATRVDAALGHTAGDWTVVTAPTCTTAGSSQKTCTVCNAVVETRVDAALGHTAGAAATCTTAQTCTVCNEVLVAALGHTAGAAATCTTAQTCTVCGEQLVAALGHTFANDCDADCDVCGATRTPAAHIAGEWKVTKEATKKEEGIKSTNCVVCGAEMTETIPMLEKGLSTGGIVAIVASSVVVLGGGAAAAWFFIIKKKRII